MADQIERTAKAAAAWWGGQLQQGDRAAFEASLRPAIEAELRARGHDYLQVDYDPQGPLLDAVRAAGVKCSGMMYSAKDILPYKTKMWIELNSLRVSEGYGDMGHQVPIPNE